MNRRRQVTDAITDPEVIALIHREREWESKQREYQWCTEVDALKRGCSNALWICVPVWLAIGRLMGWW
jgi:hypothetical protein